MNRIELATRILDHLGTLHVGKRYEQSSDAVMRAAKDRREAICITQALLDEHLDTSASRPAPPACAFCGGTRWVEICSPIGEAHEELCPECTGKAAAERLITRRRLAEAACSLAFTLLTRSQQPELFKRLDAWMEARWPEDRAEDGPTSGADRPARGTPL